MPRKRTGQASLNKGENPDWLYQPLGSPKETKTPEKPIDSVCSECGLIYKGPHKNAVVKDPTHKGTFKGVGLSHGVCKDCEKRRNIREEYLAYRRAHPESEVGKLKPWYKEEDSGTNPKTEHET